jgi:hypothetical protein
MKGYKGFDKDLKCRDKQYAVGREEREETASLCNKGLHFCENPHDVLGYYCAGDGNRFCEVEADEASDEREEDSKRVAKRLFVKTEISVFHICKIAVSTFFENFGFKFKINSADTNNAGYRGAANAGDCGAANAGDRGAANAGYRGAANAGDYGAANAGDYGAANAGYRGAANAGDCGAANAGDYGAANAGYYGSASVKENGVAIASTDGKVKGGKGSVLVLVNRDDDGNITDFAAGAVDGIVLLPDTWYRLEEGKFVVADENQITIKNHE